MRYLLRRFVCSRLLLWSQTKAIYCPRLLGHSRNHFRSTFLILTSLVAPHIVSFFEPDDFLRVVPLFRPNFRFPRNVVNFHVSDQLCICHKCTRDAYAGICFPIMQNYTHISYIAVNFTWEIVNVRESCRPHKFPTGSISCVIFTVSFVFVTYNNILSRFITFPPLLLSKSVAVSF